MAKHVAAYAVIKMREDYIAQCATNPAATA